MMARQKKNKSYLLTHLNKWFNKIYFTYRYDILALLFVELILLWVFNPLFTSGHIVFSDIDFPFNSSRYLDEIFGLWNIRWNTTTMLNIPRLLFIFPPWLISAAFGFSGEIFFKLFLMLILQTSAISMYLFTKRLLSVYISPHFNLFMALSLGGGAILYTINPWVIIRIQHIYLLCGYSLFPLVLKFFFNAFDPRFQVQIIDKHSIFRIKPYRRNVFDLMFLAFTLTVMSAAIHYFFYSVIVILSFALLLYLKLFIIHFRAGPLRRRAIFFNFLLKAAVFCFFLILFSYYWLAPYVGSLLTNTGVSQNNVNVLDTLSLFSRNSSLLNVILLNSYWWPMFDLSSLPVTFYLGGFVLLGVIIIGITKYAWRHNILLLFFLLTTIFIIFSTGVKFESLAGVFANVVTKIPVFGSIFRDPNKLIGLTAAGYSILFVFGLNFIFSAFKHDYIYSSLMRFLIIILISVSFWFYIHPVYKNFITGFYAPVAIPEEYKDVQEAFIDTDSDDSRLLYLPTADMSTQAVTGVATPFWNKNPNRDGFFKATGDFQVYSSHKNTVFHHEGTQKSFSYYLNFIHKLLDQGITENIADYLRPIGVNELAYHNEYLGQEGKQKFHLDVLDFQNEISKHYENDIFSLYKLSDPQAVPIFLDTAIHTPYGLSHLPGFINLPGIDYSKTGIIYSSLQKKSYIDKIRSGDLVEVVDFNDLFLSNIPENYYLKPFDFINEGNPFLGWSKTNISTPDWLWYLKSQNIDNFPYDFDFSSGIAVTFSSARLNVPAYQRDKITGIKILDFDTMLRLNLAFEPDNPELFQVGVNPISPGNKIPLIHGEISQGEPSDVWQVAKLGLIDAKERTAYRFAIYLSGRGANKIHLKIRFFDENQDEIGLSYAVSPNEETSFEAVNFFSEYITPPDTRYMRLDLQSFQRPEQKVYWWVHDIDIRDLSEYMTDNYIEMEIKAERSESHNIYVRVFQSPYGDELDLEINDQKVTIDTFDAFRSQFIWVNIGQFALKEGTTPVFIKNVNGFNAVNILAVIPASEMKSNVFPVERGIDKGKIFFVLEAENDFTYAGNIQSERKFPALNMGNAIASQSGTLSRQVEIVKSGSYDLLLNLQGYKERNELFVDLQQTNGETNIHEKINFDTEASALGEYGVVEFLPLDLHRGYSRKLLSFTDSERISGVFKVKGLKLPRGIYNLALRFKSNAVPRSVIRELHYFNPSEVKTTSFKEDDVMVDCSECEKINEKMMQIAVTDNKMTVSLDRTCSCDWYILSSEKIPVEVDEQVLIMFDTRSDIIRKRHSKVMYLNKENQIIRTDYIPEVAELKKVDWNRYEYIVTAPEDAVAMLFQIWSLGNKQGNGVLEIKNYEILKYNDLLKVDSLTMIESSDVPAETTPNAKVLSKERSDSMKMKLEFDNPENEEVLLRIPQPVVPMWQLSNSSETQSSDLMLNAVSTGFFTRGDGTANFAITLRKHYYAGLILLIFGFPAAWIIIEGSLIIKLKKLLLKLYRKVIKL